MERPTLIAISHTIERNKKSYYTALHENSNDLDVKEWLAYFCDMVLQAQAYTQRMIDFLIHKTHFFQKFDAEMNERQRKVVLRIFREGVEEFTEGLSADNYMRITGTTASTATRDLQKMVTLNAFVKSGERKSTRYYLNLNIE
ncbi:Fic family protein [Zhouia sp. PK063]|uniref:Fic family protein n=1 Tax=Zhouia sp. PK063 TaxID=3373602 RepID=UPI0037B64AC5